MTSKRFKRGGYQDIKIPAADKLINTDDSPRTTKLNYAQEIINMLPRGRKKLAKRFGFTDQATTGIGATETITESNYFTKADGTFEFIVGTDAGNIYSKTATGTAWSSLKTGLDTTGTFVMDHHAGSLCIVNGIDNNMYYDGSTIEDMGEYVEDNLAGNYTWIDQDSFSITPDTTRSDYPDTTPVRLIINGSSLSITGITRVSTTATATTAVAHNLANGETVTVSGANETEYNGAVTISNVTATTFDYTVSGSPTTPATGTITYAFTGITVETTVFSTSGTSPLTINLAAAVFPAASITITDVFYFDKPAPFGYIESGHDRLWALAGGEFKRNQFRNNSDRMKVFYTDTTNSVNGWFNSTTQNVGFINLEGKHGIADELLAIKVFQDKTVFAGKRATQIWTGTLPTSGGDFSWNKTIKEGIFHPKAHQEVENDWVFMTESGYRLLSKAFQSNELETTQDIGSDVNSLITDAIRVVDLSEDRYKLVNSFRYGDGNFIGFKLYNECHVFAIDKSSRGWTKQKGLFGEATAFVNTPDNRFYAYLANESYRYGDRENVFDDNNSAIETIWYTPSIVPKAGHQWANRFLEIELDPSDVEIPVEFSRIKDNQTIKTDTSSITTPRFAAQWDVALWDQALWDDNTEFKYPSTEDKYKAHDVAYVIKTNTTTGPFEITSLNLYGTVER